MTALFPLLPTVQGLIYHCQPLSHFPSAEELVNLIEDEFQGEKVELGEPKLEPTVFHTVGDHPFTLQTHRGDKNGPIIAKLVSAREFVLCSRTNTSAW